MTQDRNDELRRIARKQIRRRRRLRAHAFAVLLGNILLAIVWARRNHDWDPWIGYPTIAGLVSLAAHWWTVERWRAVSTADVERELARLR